MQDKEIALLEQILFDKEFSRNKNFDTFQNDDLLRRLHSIARQLRFLHQELKRADIQCSIQNAQDGRLCVRIHDPLLSSIRTLYLTPSQWALLEHPRWEQL